jgi:hypothetical protein
MFTTTRTVLTAVVSAGVCGVVIAAPSSAYAGTDSPSADNATVVDGSRAGIETVPCIDGPVYVTEDNHEVMRWAPDATGALHLTDDVTQSFTLTRVDAAGTAYGQTYTGRATIHISGLIPPGTDPQNATPNSYVFSVRGVDPAGDVLTIRQVAHIALDAAGAPTVLFDRVTC